MRFVFIAPGYYPHIGGVEYVVKSIAERLVKLGHEIIVLAGEPHIEEPNEEKVNEVRVIRWPTWNPTGAYHIPRRINEFEKKLLVLARGADVIHIHSFHAVFTVLAGLKIGETRSYGKIVVTGHYHGGGHTAFRHLLWRFWRLKVKSLLGIADVIHCVSQSEKMRILKHYPEFEEKIVVIPNGVDEDVFTYKWRGQESNYMLYAGRIEKYKKLDEAIKLSKTMNLKLTIIGQGPYKENLMKIAEKLYPNGVEFKDFLPRSKYLETLANARYAINLSNKEAYSIFIAEALAIGIPAIVSPTIEKIYGIRGSSELHPYLISLSSIVRKFGLKILVNHGLGIKTWSQVVEEVLRIMYQ